MSSDNNQRQNHTLSLTAVLEIASNLPNSATPTGYCHRGSMVGITCNGADRVFPKEYMIKAFGYGSVEDILQPNTLYSLKGRFLPANDPKKPGTGKHEFFFEAANRLLVGTTETFTSDLHDTVGVTGFGIIIHKFTIFEDSVQPKAVKEGKADRKVTHVFIVRHRDYHPVTRRTVEFTVKYLCRPYPHIASTAQFLHLGREVNINGYIVDYEVEEDRYVVDMKGATVASGHEDIAKNPPAVLGTATPAGRIKPARFSDEAIVISSSSSGNSSGATTVQPQSSSSSIEVMSTAEASGSVDDVPALLFPPADFAASSFSGSPAAITTKRAAASRAKKTPAKTPAKTLAKTPAKKKSKNA